MIVLAHVAGLVEVLGFFVPAAILVSIFTFIIVRDRRRPRVAEDESDVDGAEIRD